MYLYTQFVFLIFNASPVYDKTIVGRRGILYYAKKKLYYRKLLKTNKTQEIVQFLVFPNLKELTIIIK